MDQVLSNYKIHNPLANLDSARGKEIYIYFIFTNILYMYSFETVCLTKHTVKTRSCPRQTQMPLIVLSLSSPNIQALANAPFLNESNRWYIPLIKLQDMKTYSNTQKVHMLMIKYTSKFFNLSNII